MMRTIASSLRRTRPLLALAATLFFAACGDSASEPTVDGLEIADIVLETAAGEVIYSHIDHWHGFAVVDLGTPLEVTVHFVPRSSHPDDHDVVSRDQWFTLQDHPEYGLDVVVEDPSLATWAGDRVSGRLTGAEVGTTRTSFVVRRGGTTIFEAPPLNVVVR
jgi:hypothetical protein